MVELVGRARIPGADDRTLEQVQADAISSAKAEYDRRLNIGFAHDFGTADAPDPQTLQVASTANQSDWLVLDTACRDAIGAGQGDQDMEPAFRCTSNAMRTVSWSAAKQILADARTWGGQMRAVLWGKTDAIAAAADVAAVGAIDLTAGYPA